MKENIKVLEEFIDAVGEEYEVVKEKQALENLIKGYRELEEIEEAHRELNGELRKELQPKDKMIDLMAHQINTKVFGKNDWCPMYKGKGCSYKNTCEKCIKEYFIKKASEKNE